MATQTKVSAEMKALELKHRESKRRKNPNHVVHPNLTPRGRDILMRLQNKSLDTNSQGSYTLNEEIVNARLMGKHELIDAAKRNQEKISGLQKSLQENATKKHSQPKPESNDAK